MLIEGNIGKGKALRNPNHQSPEVVVEVVRGQGPGHVTEIQDEEVIQGIVEIVQVRNYPNFLEILKFCLGWFNQF